MSTATLVYQGSLPSFGNLRGTGTILPPGMRLVFGNDAQALKCPVDSTEDRANLTAFAKRVKNVLAVLWGNTGNLVPRNTESFDY